MQHTLPSQQLATINSRPVQYRHRVGMFPVETGPAVTALSKAVSLEHVPAGVSGPAEMHDQEPVRNLDVVVREGSLPALVTPNLSMHDEQVLQHPGQESLASPHFWMAPIRLTDFNQVLPDAEVIVGRATNLKRCTTLWMCGVEPAGIKHGSTLYMIRAGRLNFCPICYRQITLSGTRRKNLYGEVSL